MRSLIMFMAVLGLLVVQPSAALAAAGGDNYAIAAEQPPTGQMDVEVDVNEGGWWVSPVWIAIGAIAIVLLIVIVALAFRGGGTTVIKE